MIWPGIEPQSPGSLANTLLIRPMAHPFYFIYILTNIYLYFILYFGGACGVMVIVVGNGHGDTSSNPGRNWLHFT